MFIRQWQTTERNCYLVITDSLQQLEVIQRPLGHATVFFLATAVSKQEFTPSWIKLLTIPDSNTHPTVCG